MTTLKLEKIDIYKEEVKNFKEGKVEVDEKILAHNWLTLHGAFIGSEGIRQLLDDLNESLGRLNFIDLARNALSARSSFLLCKHILPKCTTLVHLHLGNNRLKDVGTKLLVGAIINSPCLSTLITLDLCYNIIKDDGAKAIAQLILKSKNEGATVLSKALVASSSIRTILIPFNEIEEKGGIELIKAAKTNQSIMKFIIDGNLWPEKLTKKMKGLMEERANSLDLDFPVEEKAKEQTSQKEEDFSDFLNRKETDFDEEEFEPLTTEDLLDSRRIRILENLYRKAILPEASAHVPIHALISVTLNSLEDIDSVKQSINLNASISVFFKDPAAIGNIFDHFDSKSIFNPDIEISNAIEMNKLKENNYWLNLEWSGYGVVSHVQQFKGSVSVPLNLRRFPFDKQLVDITFRSANWSDFDLVLIDETEVQNLRDMKKKTEPKLLEWSIDSEMNITKESFYKPEESRSYDELKLKFEAKRLVQYYGVKIIAVVILLVIMSWVLFFFDSNDLSGRSSTAITIFLAAVAFHFIVGSVTPKTSYTTTMDRFMFLTYLYLVLPLLESVVVLFIVKSFGDETAKYFDWASLIGISSTYILAVIILFTRGK